MIDVRKPALVGFRALTRNWRTAPVLGGLAVGLLLLFLALGRAGSRGAGPSPIQGSPSTLVDAPGGSAGTDAGVPAGATDGAGPESRRAAIPAGAAPASTCLVRVVEAASGAALPGARLWIQDEDVRWEDPAWWRAMRRSNDVEAVLASGLGRELALDERGEVRVPRPVRALSVAAALGSLHGEAVLAKDAEACVVELEPFHALEVEVVDRAGRPVPGALIVLFWGEFDPLEDDNLLPTDERGRLSIAKLEGQIYEHGGEGGPVRMTLAAGVPCQPELVEFTLDAVPSEPVRLVAGDFASVLVQVTDPQGRALALEGSAHLEIGTERLEEPSLALRAGALTSLPLSEGRALFACVGLGLPLEIGCSPRGYDGEWRAVEGPSVSGQELYVPVPVSQRTPTVRGRVTGGVGAGMLTGRRPVRLPDFHSRIDEDGLFERTLPFAVEPRLLADPWELRLQRSGAPTLWARVVPLVDGARSAIDFGELVLAPLAALARVRVVDGGGAPVALAWIELETGSGRLGQWSDEHGLALLEGRVEDLPLRVRATHEAWLPSDWLVVSSFGAEATLVLRRGAALEGRVRLPRGGNLWACELRLAVAPAAGATVPAEHSAELVEGGRFRFQAVEPGHGRLTVLYDHEPVHEQEVELAAGARTTLPEIDLGARLRRFSLTFALASGAPWLGGHLEVRKPGEWSWADIGSSARASLFSARPALDLWVSGRGARPTSFEGVLDGDRLVLPDAPSILLRLPRTIPLPADPLALVARAERTAPEEVAYETDDGGEAMAGADGLLRLSVPWPGVYELSWLVRHTGTGAEFEVELEEPELVPIDDSSATRIVDARLAPAALERAVLEAEGR